jgi:hypothetical protein
MKYVAIAVVVLLVVASGGLGYYIGVTSQGGVSTDSSATTGGSIPTYQLSILNANWTVYPSTGSRSCYVSSPSQSAMSESGSCSLSSLSFVTPGRGEYHPGPPVSGGTFPMGPSESGTAVLTVMNSIQ